MPQISSIDAITQRTDPRGRNALKDGLFAVTPYVRDIEQEDYAHMAAALLQDLNPEGALQELFTSEIIGASWRLHRCNLVEARLATESDLDPMADEVTGKIQKSVDRARAQSHTILRRSLAEVRKLQTQAKIEAEPASKPIATQPKALEIASKPFNIFDLDSDDLDLNNPVHFAAFDQLVQSLPLSMPKFTPPTPEKPAMDLFCKTAVAPVPPAKTPVRNRPCPCGSGVKYKKCCGGPLVQDEKQAA